MSAAVRRILELEARGITMSRNRHFEVFQEHQNRAALQVWRHVAAVRRSLFQHRRLGEVTLSLEALDGGTHHRLIAQIDEISARLEWRLHAGEIGLLLRDLELRRWFENAGVPTPHGCVDYMQEDAEAPE